MYIDLHNVDGALIDVDVRAIKRVLIRQPDMGDGSYILFNDGRDGLIVREYPDVVILLMIQELLRRLEQ